MFTKKFIRPSSTQRRKSATITATMILALVACGDSTSFQSRVDVGEQFLTNGQYSEGYGILTDVTEKNATSAQAALSVGDAYLRQGAFTKAATSFDLAIARGDEIGGLVGKGRVALARNASQEALVLFGQVLEKESDNVDALNGVGVAYDIVGDHAAARQSYQNALLLEPNHFASNNNLGLSLALGGNSDQAVAALSELSRSNLDSSKVRQNLAFAYHMRGDENNGLRISMIDLTESQGLSNAAVFKQYRAWNP